MRSRRAVAAVLIALATASGACSTSTSSETVEMDHDPADVTIAGVPPTAPPSTTFDGSGLSASANDLIAQLAAIQTETDLCVILTGEAFQPFLGGTLDTTNLVTSPSGLTQLLIAVDSIFAHIVEISPPPVQPAAATIQDVWTRIASINSAAADYQAQVDAILVEPEVIAAYQSLGGWVTANCAGT
ncbi:MAG: hypothetical protein ACYC2O_05660, partial [Microthrixaceae bacterium]